MAARGVPMIWERTYRSNRTLLKIAGPEDKSYDYIAPEDGPLGYGWHSPFSMRIIGNAAAVSDPVYNCDALLDADGRIVYFPKNRIGAVEPDYANGYTLAAAANGWTLTQRGGSTWTFDEGGKLTQIADPLARTAYLVYTGDQLTAIRDTAGRTIYTLTWTDGHITKVTDLASRTITYEYDNGNLVNVSHTDPATGTPERLFTYGYNGSHGLTTNANAMDETWRINYRYPPTRGIAVSLIAPDQGSLVQNFDRSMATVTIKDPGGQTRTQTRNEEGRLTGEADNTGAKTQTIAYLGGGVRTITDSDNNITKETRNQWDELTQRIDAEQGVTKYDYNDKGKPTYIKDAEDSITEINYDPSGTLPATITRAKGMPEQTVTTFGYFPNGDLQSTATADSVTKFTYNAAGLPLTITDPENNTTNLEYDDIGNLTSSTDANTNRTEYSYDWRGNLKTVKVPVTDSEQLLTTYSYNSAGRLTAVTDPKLKTTSVASNYRGQITNTSGPAGVTSYTYDKNGNPETVTKGDAVTTYVFDGKNRLLSLKDPENNLTTYGYAKGGACTTCGANAGAFTTPTSINDPLNKVTLSTLDKLGRIKEIDDPMSYTETGTTKKTYGWRPGGIWGTNPVFMTENDQIYFYHNDHLGTPQTMTDQNGDIVWEATYEAFGKAQVDPESTIVNNLRFPGQYWDEETGLHYNWNRYYDPGAGRYVSKDPIGILKGRNHLFVYGKNNSNYWIDPYGLLCTKANPAPANLLGDEF